MKTHFKPTVTRRQFLGGATAAAGLLSMPWLARAQAPAVSEAERQKIEAALPKQTFAKPLKPRRLLIFDLNVNYGGHGSIRTANLAFTLMGKKTGAFETVVSRDPSVFLQESLRQFDAVFFNNNVGNCFTDPILRQNLVEFVYGGGGLMGVHGTSVAFTQWPGAVEDWPEFGLMIGARGANHRTSDEHVFIKVEDSAHSVTQPFGGQGFDYRDEFFRVHDPFSRNRLRVLLSIDTEKTDLKQGQTYGKLERADNDFALAWVRNYGRGRTFYCTIAHNPYVFWDAKMLQFYLAAAQFILGDLPAPTTPSGRLTPPLRAQEELGWRLGLDSLIFRQDSIVEVIDRAAQLGLLYLGASDVQPVRRGAKGFGPELSNDELRQARLKLDAAGVRLLTYEVRTLPLDEAGWRAVFGFARKMGVECIIAQPKPDSLGLVEQLCDQFDLRLALNERDPASGSPYSPAEVLKLCQGRSPRLGACGDFLAWARRGLAPLETIRTLKERLITVQLHDVQELSTKAHDVPWGSGVVRFDECLKELRRIELQPVMFGVDHHYSGPDFASDLGQCVKAFNKTSLELAKGKTQ
jgi:type 1 glutamine amidotransferase/sugar phosphate isomerase/epimerase